MRSVRRFMFKAGLSSRPAALIMALGVLVGLIALGVSAPRAPVEAAPPDRPTVIVKFAEGSDVRLRGGRLVSLSGEPLRGVDNALVRFANAQISRVFTRPEADLDSERARGQAAANRSLPDLNLFYQVQLRPGADADALIAALQRLSIVESAYLAPDLAPPPQTPDFESMQGYLEDAPDGIGARFVWGIPGGRGTGITIADVEYCWNVTHEDLSKATTAKIVLSDPDNDTVTCPVFSNDPDGMQHGTAVLGELIADDNGFGVTGMVPDADIRMSPQVVNGSFNRPDALNRATGALGPGDVLLIESQTAGANGGCDATTQNGCVAVEFLDAEFAAIVTATSLGIIVVAAAGNGNEDLDDEAYDGSNFRLDSGSIIVGAGVAPGFVSPARSKLGFSTFGSRVDVQGWGNGVTTTGYGDLFDGTGDGGAMDPNRFYRASFGGTSSASPFVAAAAAAVQGTRLAAGEPFLSPAEMRALLKATGTPQQDGDCTVAECPIGPLVNTLAALQALTQPPQLTVDNAVVTVNEGQVATNSGTFSDPDGDPVTLSASIGTVTDTGGGTWTWSFQTVDGPAESQTVTITGTDDKLVEGSVTFALVVDNVAPTVTIDPAQVTVINEGETLTVLATFADPGLVDFASGPFGAVITCYDVGGFLEEVTGTIQVVSNAPPLLQGTVTGECTYGDTSQAGDPPSGTFTVTVTVTDKDGGVGLDSFELTVVNVDPEVTIQGGPTFLTQVGETVDFTAGVSDPGSDDLFLTWNWADGSFDTVDYFLINAASPDPFPSPNVAPRDITDEQSHAWAEACLYDITLTALDDDGGSGQAEATVIVIGDSGQARGAGFWLHQYRGRGSLHFDQETLDCYLAIVEHLSTVFDEERDGTSSHAAAAGVLFVAGNSGDRTEVLDQQLLAAWLNFANGAFGLDDPVVDTDGDGIPDATFLDVVAAAEAVRLDAGATREQLEEQKDILEAMNLMHGG